MNRIMKLSISTVAAASVAAGGFALASTGVAAAAARPAAVHVQSCTVSAKNYRLPALPTTFRAGTAGSVTVAARPGSLRVVGIHPASGWRGYVDSWSGSSVDVYFRSGSHTLKFEAEINDAGGLTVTITSC